jgi:hypothetical protein
MAHHRIVHLKQLILKTGLLSSVNNKVLTKGKSKPDESFSEWDGVS